MAQLTNTVWWSTIKTRTTVEVFVCFTTISSSVYSFAGSAIVEAIKKVIELVTQN